MVDRSRFDYRFLTMTQTPDLPDESLIERAYLRPLFEEIGFRVESLGEPDTGAGSRRGLLQILCSSWGMLRTVRRLVKYIRENRIEVIDAHHTSAMFAASIAGWLTGTPVVLTAYHIAAWKRPGMGWLGQLTFGWASDRRARRSRS